MAHHVFTEDQSTMEWYIDGIPVAELKRRYEAHDALVKALEGMLGAWNMVCDANDWERDHIQQQKDAVSALAAEVRNG